MSHLRRIIRNLSILLGVVCLSSALVIAAQSSEGRSRVAFVTANYDTREMTISLADPVSGEITPVVNEGYFFYPVISPDGRSLVFLGENPRTKHRNLYVMNTDGSNLRPLVERDINAKPDGQAAWSPDSTQVIYGVSDNRRRLSFFRVGVDGGEPEEIVFEGVEKGSILSTSIASSPDGSRLAFLVEIPDAPSRAVYIANADGSGVQPITATLPNGQAFDALAWVLDGQQTLLSVLNVNSREPQPLMLGDADGANAQILISPPPNYMGSVSWSPDNSQIVFLAAEIQSDVQPDGEVYVANADGSNVRALNIPINVAYVGTSWGMIPDDVVLPATPTSFIGAIE